jgi:hypothetical protein
MRLLIAFDENYRVYRDATAGAIRGIRPGVEVEVTTLEKLKERIQTFDPHLVICTRENSADPNGCIAWIGVSVDPLRPTKLCIGGRRSEHTNPSITVLLSALDETERILAKREVLGCR